MSERQTVSLYLYTGEPSVTTSSLKCEETMCFFSAPQASVIGSHTSSKRALPGSSFHQVNGFTAYSTVQNILIKGEYARCNKRAGLLKQTGGTDTVRRTGGNQMKNRGDFAVSSCIEIDPASESILLSNFITVKLLLRDILYCTAY